MPRLAHGAVPTAKQLRAAQSDLATRAADVELGFAVAGPAALQDFDFLFLQLQDNAANLLRLTFWHPQAHITGSQESWSGTQFCQQRTRLP